MARRAWIFIWSVFITTAVVFGAALFSFKIEPSEWAMVVVMTLLATFAQLYKVEAPSNKTYYVSTIFLFASALLLSPMLFAVVVTISYLVEWLKERLVNSPLLRRWYLQPFNICAHLLAGFAAKTVFIIFSTNVLNFQASPEFFTLEAVLGTAVSAVAYITVNHLLIGLALVLARGATWQESGVLDSEALLIEMVLLLMGAVSAALWTINPWLLIPALSPLLLIYKTLRIPQLKHDARTDGKTGLLNAKAFTERFTMELDRARRFKRPLSLIMADLDLLRNINNTYGHLAGDKVLAEIGRVIQATVREFDVAGRFGGEEFAIVLPEVDLDEARVVAERLREAVQQTRIEIATSDKPIQITMSLGVACLAPNAQTITEILHSADIALYQAKLQGRNRVICISDVPHSLDLESTERLAPPTQTYQFVPRASAPVYTNPSYMPSAAHANANGQSVQVNINNGSTTNGHTTDEVLNKAISMRQTGPLPIISDIEDNLEDDLAESAEAGLYTSPGIVITKPLPIQSADAPMVAAAAEAAPTKAPPAGSAHSQLWLSVFVGCIITLGLVAVVGSFVYMLVTDAYDVPLQALTMLGILIVGAVLAEYFQITLYGPDTLSVSMALNFAAAPILGIPGVAAVSLAIALMHYVRRRPAFYKTLFNWATHLLAGLPAVYLMGSIQNIELLSQMAVLAASALAASIIYFVIETGLVTAAISLAGMTNPLNIWKERFQWLAGHYVALGITGLFIVIAYFAIGPLSVLAFLVPIVMMRYSQKQYVDRTEGSVLELKRMNAELTHANREVSLANLAVQELNEELFLTLSKIIDARDPYVGGHASKVADYAIAIARELGMPEHRLEPLRQAGFLHDIGKIGISEQVLHKPSKLTEEEYEYVKKHAALGGEFLETCRALRHLAPFVRHHHERWDGRGYPDKLVADEIELEARILAVCDAAEAMASDRPYRKGMSLDQMLEEIKRCAGTQFDPDVARAFVLVVERERERLVTNSAQEVMQKYSDSVIQSAARDAAAKGQKAPQREPVSVASSSRRSSTV